MCTTRIMACTPFIGEVLRRSLFDTAPFNVLYNLSLSTSLIPQLQLRLRSLVCVQSFGQPAFTKVDVLLTVHLSMISVINQLNTKILLL